MCSSSPAWALSPCATGVNPFMSSTYVGPLAACKRNLWTTLANASQNKRGRTPLFADGAARRRTCPFRTDLHRDRCFNRRPQRLLRKYVFPNNPLRSSMAAMTTDNPLPPDFDPEHEVLLNERSLRALAHPVRVKLLGLLRIEGPATATGLAEKLGLNSGATSYHLRQLAGAG